MSFPIQNYSVDSLLPTLELPIDVLRLDRLHPIVSGNKWFKLKAYLALAKAQQKTTLLTFGGAYSNHIVATASAALSEGFKSIGIIRGQEPKDWSHTLVKAKSLGMQLFFVSREDYRQKQVSAEVYQLATPPEVLVIPEGGYGLPGMDGAKDILKITDTSSYTYIVAAVGTGTTLAGLTAAAHPHQKVVGISVLKNAHSLQQEIKDLLPDDKRDAFKLNANYHFGGYAKKSDALLNFMNSFYEQTNIPTDFVYTAKAFYAVLDLYKKQLFSEKHRTLLIHTGGLQGNLSLPKGTLIFG